LPVVVAARVGRLLDFYGIDAQLQQDEGEERGRIGPIAGIAMFWLLVPFAVYGSVTLGRSAAGRRARAVLAAPIVIAVVVAAAFYGTHRLRAPAEPSMVILAAVGAVAALRVAAARLGEH
ncbi:MAG: glycosyl transferase, partial [Ilumatobacteraceae bacterium]